MRLQHRFGISLGARSARLFVTLLHAGITRPSYDQWAPWRLPADSAWVWRALLAYDFCYYWHHRAGHRVALFWASARGAPPERGLQPSTALRQTGGWPAGWIFYLPMALAGVRHL